MVKRLTAFDILSRIALVALVVSLSIIGDCFAADRTVVRPHSTITYDSKTGTSIAVTDTNANGIPDHIEITRGPLKVTKSVLYKGRFLSIRVQEKQAKGLLQAGYNYDPRHNRYIMTENRLLPYRTLKSEVRCEEPRKQLADLTKVLEALRQGDTDLSPVLDKSCSEGPFEPYQKALKEGIYQVIGSGEKKQGLFLACMRQHGMGQEADAFEASFALAMDLKKPSYQCRLDEMSGTYGYFNPKTEIVTFARTTHLSKGPEPDPQFFASVFFHETLHKSGILREDLVLSTEACCSVEGGKYEDSCDTMEKLAGERRGGAAIMSALAWNFSDEMNELIPRLQGDAEYSVFNNMAAGYLHHVDELGKGRGGAGQPDQVFDACLHSDELKDKSFEQREAICMSIVVERSKKDISEYIDANCHHYYPDKLDRNGADHCAKIKTEMHKFVEDAIKKMCPDDELGPPIPCLFKTFKDAKAMRDGKKESPTLLFATPTGTPVEDDRLKEMAKPLSPEEVVRRKKMLDAYLKSFTANVGGVKEYWAGLQTEVDAEGARMIAVNFLQQVPKTDEVLKDCVGSEFNPARLQECSHKSYKTLTTFMEKYFKDECPHTYKKEGAERTCLRHYEKMTAIVEKSVHGGCAQRVVGTDINMMCLNSAFSKARSFFDEQGNFNEAKYDEDEKVPWSYLPEEEARRLANAAAMNALQEQERGFESSKVENVMAINQSARGMDALAAKIAGNNPSNNAGNSGSNNVANTTGNNTTANSTGGAVTNPYSVAQATKDITEGEKLAHTSSSRLGPLMNVGVQPAFGATSAGASTSSTRSMHSRAPANIAVNISDGVGTMQLPKLALSGAPQVRMPGGDLNLSNPSSSSSGSGIANYFVSSPSGDRAVASVGDDDARSAMAKGSSKATGESAGSGGGVSSPETAGGGGGGSGGGFGGGSSRGPHSAKTFGSGQDAQKDTSASQPKRDRMELLTLIKQKPDDVFKSLHAGDEGFLQSLDEAGIQIVVTPKEVYGKKLNPQVVYVYRDGGFVASKAAVRGRAP